MLKGQYSNGNKGSYHVPAFPFDEMILQQVMTPFVKESRWGIPDEHATSTATGGNCRDPIT